MKVIAIGDNVVDCYIDQNIYYPGGNAVNVAVHYKRNTNKTTAYMGVFGNDKKAKHIKEALSNEGIPYHGSRVVMAPSGSPRVRLVDNDRVFDGGITNSAQRVVSIQLIPEDLEYISGFDLCYSSCYSSIENELPKIKSAVKMIAYDFSDKIDESYIKKVAPYLTYAFFSGSNLSEEKIDNIFSWCYSEGVKYVCITKGEKGAVLFDGKTKYQQGIKQVEIVDTMGAGDAFISSFLSLHINGRNITESLNYAAEKAAEACTFYGGFGYPHTMEPADL